MSLALLATALFVVGCASSNHSQDANSDHSSLNGYYDSKGYWHYYHNRSEGYYDDYGRQNDYDNQ